jgi:uncharacterized protein (DUF2267 family)
VRRRRAIPAEAEKMEAQLGKVRQKCMADPPNQTNKKKSFIQKKSFFKKIYEII